MKLESYTTNETGIEIAKVSMTKEDATALIESIILSTDPPLQKPLGTLAVLIDIRNNLRDECRKRIS